MIGRLRRVLPQRLRIGLSVGERTVRAVGVRGALVLWAFEAELDDGESMSSAIQQVLDHAPLPRWPRPALTAAIGPSRSQVRQLVDLPPVKDRRALAAIIREGASRFFLRNGVPLVTSQTALSPVDGAPWAAAFDGPVIDEIVAACQKSAVRFETAFPSVAVLGRVLQRDQLTWVDGESVADCRYDHGVMCELRRRRASQAAPAIGGHDDGSTESAVPAQLPLAALGAGAILYADAYGAATSPRRGTLAYTPGHDAGVAPHLPRWRIALAASLLALSTGAAIAAPALRDLRTIAHAESRLAILNAERAEAERLERELELVGAALGEVSRFAAQRQSPLGILEALADSLPDGSALVMLRLDTLAGTAVVLAPRIAAVVATLDRVPVVTGVEIVGPVTRESVGGRELERATVKFQLDGGESASPPSPEERT